jgi:Stage II sporulation protein E (SpoIIE)
VVTGQPRHPFSVKASVDAFERTDSRPPMGWRALLLGCVLGFGLFTLGLTVARARLPEWQLRDLPEREFLVARFKAAAERLGIRLAGEPRVVVDESRSSHNNPYVLLGTEAEHWIRERRRPVYFTLTARGATDQVRRLEMSAKLGLNGEIWHIVFTRIGLDMLTPLSDEALPDGAPVLLGPGESLGEAISGTMGGGPPFRVASVVGGGETEAVILIGNPQTNSWGASRSPGTAERVASTFGLGATFVRIGLLAVILLVVLVAAFVLAVRRRIDFINAASASLFVLLVSGVAAVAERTRGLDWIAALLMAGLSAVFLFFLWASAESWLRATGREGTTALDALRAGRIGRRVGRGSLWGLVLGAAIAGWHLLTFALAATIPGGVPEVSSVVLPLFRPGATPVDSGLGAAGLALLGIAVGRHLARGRWATLCSLLCGTVVSLPSLSTLQPWYLSVALVLGVVALLNLAFERAGSLALAVAGVVGYLLPTFAFSLQDPSWFASGLWGSGGLLVGIGVLGFVGAFRPESVQEAVPAPSFMRRLEEEKRLQFETAILARIQEGLLPEQLPRIDGWEFAARSIQAHEVGGDFYDFFHAPDGALWVVAGDVAGHGISCSITHAMTKAALAALIRSGETPGRVLGEVDRVLRTLTTSRLFTSLALLRLDTETGEATFSNAGFPYPLQRDGREVTELVAPGLPAGEGPSRRYLDLEIQIPPGGALVFCSDGLAEALRPDGEPYGYDRPRQVLAAAPSRSADDLLGALVSDWHREVGERAEDDTTLLVLRRRG